MSEEILCSQYSSVRFINNLIDLADVRDTIFLHSSYGALGSNQSPLHCEYMIMRGNLKTVGRTFIHVAIYCLQIN